MLIAISRYYRVGRAPLAGLKISMRTSGWLFLSDMKRILPLLLGASVLIMFSASLAGPHEYLFRDKSICDGNEVFCFRGTLSYYSNPRLLHLRARVQKAPGSGMLRIRLSGANQQGDRRLAPFEVRVNGHYSEIINHKIIPDHPDVEHWAVERVEFIVDKVLR